MRILIVEDHQLLRQGIVECLNREFPGSIVGVAGSVGEARLRLRNSWDIVLLDLALPDASGFTLLKDIKRDSSGTKVIVLTASSEDDLGLPALNAGADGFVMKTASFSHLSEAIRTVCAGRRYFPAPLIERVMGTMPKGGQLTSKFSRRELDILRLTADGLSTRAIAEEISISVKTVETYRARICQKLHIRGFAAFVRFAVLSQMPGQSSETPARHSLLQDAAG